jgi:uncharacterized protein YkwD
MSKDYSMRVGNRVIIPLVVFALVALGLVTVGISLIQQDGGSQLQTQEQEQAQDLPAVARQQQALNADLMEQLINEERAKLALPPLPHSETLRASACAKLDHMFTYDYWAHTAPDGTEPWHFFNVVGYSYTKAGENLAYGQRSESEVVADWMNSPAHRDNIVGGYAESGLCTRLEMYQGWTQTITVHHFGTRQ